MEADLHEWRKACIGAKRTQHNRVVLYTKNGQTVAYMVWDNGRWIRKIGRTVFG